MLNVVTSGTWTGVSNANLPGLTGVGTDKIKWGDVPYDVKSGYAFAGSATTAPLDGTDFLLGELTHYNYTIPLPDEWQFWVNLEVNVFFEEAGTNKTIPLHFRHEETPNQSAHPHDTVQIPHFKKDDVLYLPEGTYGVEITGFWVGTGSNKIKSPDFDVPEGGSRKAGIFASIKKVKAPGS
ncbi:choice-of-anchor K domain-containing protein [Streptomyces sp. NPDC003077]|uniref:choice-of-anchor K domain-containing protein n=1 Tax=Streptomyces sp. NPDC003077 TaxID=3154443 RepID=UPI0033B21BF4